MKEAGILTADFWVVNSAEVGCQTARQLNGPLVVRVVEIERLRLN